MVRLIKGDLLSKIKPDVEYTGKDIRRMLSRMDFVKYEYVSKYKPNSLKVGDIFYKKVYNNIQFGVVIEINGEKCRFVYLTRLSLKTEDIHDFNSGLSVMTKFKFCDKYYLSRFVFEIDTQYVLNNYVTSVINSNVIDDLVDLINENFGSIKNAFSYYKKNVSFVRFNILPTIQNSTYELLSNNLCKYFKDEDVYTSSKLLSFFNKMCIDSYTHERIAINISKGDVFKCGFFYKERPCVVIDVIDDVVKFIPLSTKDASLYSTEIYNENRFINKNYFCKGVNLIYISYVKSSYMFSLDNLEKLDLAINVNNGLLKV